MTPLGAFRNDDVPDVLSDMGVYVQPGLLEQPVDATNFVFTEVQVVDGVAKYLYSSYSGPAPVPGPLMTVTGFAIGGNNVAARAITAIATGSVSVAATTQADETHAGAGVIPEWTDVLDLPTSATPKGLLDENDMAIAADRGNFGVVAAERTLTVQASMFGGVRVDDALVLTDANDMTQRLQVFVSDRIKEGDAALVKFALREVQ